MNEHTVLPPDAPLVDLAKIVNARLIGARVDFYRIMDGADHVETGIIFQNGPARATVKTRAMLSAHDANEIVAAVTRWAEGRRLDKWTTDIRETG